MKGKKPHSLPAVRQEDQSSGARSFDAVMHRDIGNLIGVDRARPAQLFADEIPAQEASSIQAPPKSMAEYREDGLEFEVAGEEHTVWIQPMGDEVVVMVASDPVPVTKQLLDWQKRLSSIQDAVKRQNTKDLISKCFDRIKILGEIGAEDNEDRQASAVSNHMGALKEFMKGIMWAFSEAGPLNLGATAVYRGLHFDLDWQQKRGRTVGEEAGRTFEEVRAEGTFSSATWEVAKALAKASPVSRMHLETANDLVMKEVALWKTRKDANRVDTSAKGADAIAKRANLAAAISHFEQQHNEAKADEFRENLRQLGDQFSQGVNAFPSQFEAALSQYVNSQRDFEQNLAAQSDGSYPDVPFSSIPFISTTKVPIEAVKYAKGKLASDAQKSTEGVVGRVLIYVASKADFLEANGIDVWEEMRKGHDEQRVTLKFTDWRMAENEITFSGKIPESFLAGMTPIYGDDTDQEAAKRVEQDAFKLAAPFGGLQKLPKNEPF